jgi:hypothetical protein
MPGAAGPASATVWPQWPQVCWRSPPRHSLNTAVQVGHRTGGAIAGTAGGTGSRRWTQTFPALGSYHRRP